MKVQPEGPKTFPTCPMAWKGCLFQNFGVGRAWLDSTSGQAKRCLLGAQSFKIWRVLENIDLFVLPSI